MNLNERIHLLWGCRHTSSGLHRTFHIACNDSSENQANEKMLFA